MNATATGAVLIPVLEIGGTHITAALVEKANSRHGDSWAVVRSSVRRRHLDAHASADEILDAVADSARELGTAHNGRWGVAIPGPFDYRRGIGQFERVGKFDQLNGVDLRAALARRLSVDPAAMSFLNDADAFAIGENAIGVAGQHRRAVCFTLGTGVGSTFLDRGVPVKSGPDVPPEGYCHLLNYDGVPLEDNVSRRAIRSAYAVGTGHPIGSVPDVREIADAARRGDDLARRVLEHAFGTLGRATAPFLLRFQAEVVIIGGSMAGSWDIVEPAVRRGMQAAVPALKGLPITQAERAEEAGLIGTAYGSSSSFGA